MKPREGFLDATHAALLLLWRGSLHPIPLAGVILSSYSLMLHAGSDTVLWQRLALPRHGLMSEFRFGSQHSAPLTPRSAQRAALAGCAQARLDAQARRMAAGPGATWQRRLRYPRQGENRRELGRQDEYSPHGLAATYQYVRARVATTDDPSTSAARCSRARRWRLIRGSVHSRLDTGLLRAL